MVGGEIFDYYHSNRIDMLSVSTFSLSADAAHAGVFTCTAKYLDGQIIGQDSIDISYTPRRCPESISVSG